MSVTRRRLLAGGGLVVATGLGGCVPPGPNPRIVLEVAVRDAYETGSPVSVPLTVGATISEVASRTAGFTGVTLECYDAALERIDRRPLGDFTWETAASSQRTTDGDGEETRYDAEWERDVRLDLPAVPMLVTFQIDGVAVEGESRSRSLFVGSARALSPPPGSEVRGVYFDAASRPPATVVPTDYETFSRYIPRELDAIVGDTPVAPEGFFPGRRLRRLELVLENTTIRAGEETTASVDAHFANGDSADVTGWSTIHSPDRMVATVDGRTIVGRATGTVTVEAEYANRTVGADLRILERDDERATTEADG